MTDQQRQVPSMQDLQEKADTLNTLGYQTSIDYTESITNSIQHDPGTIKLHSGPGSTIIAPNTDQGKIDTEDMLLWIQQNRNPHFNLGRHPDDTPTQ